MRQTRRAFRTGIDGERLAADLRRAGICPGDLIFVHSSLSKLGNIIGGPAVVVAALQDAVTESGTLVMPSYGSAADVFDAMRRNEITDLRKARSLTGAITEAFRQQSGVVRSSHPFSSVCAWGRHAEFITAGHHLDPRICHSNSPLARVHEMGGKVVGMGVTLGPVSFYHVVEDTWPQFPIDPYVTPGEVLTYIDGLGKEVTREVRHYADKWRQVRIDGDGGLWIREVFTRHFVGVGALGRCRVGEADSWTIEARRFYDEVKALAERGLTIYTTPEESKNVSHSTA